MKPSLQYSPFLSVIDWEELRKKQNPNCKHEDIDMLTHKCRICGRSEIEIIQESYSKTT